MFEVHDPYHDDKQAIETFGRAEHLVQKSKVPRRFMYRQLEPGTLEHIWRTVHPRDIVIAAEDIPQIGDINPEFVRYELTPYGKVAEVHTHW